MLSREKVFCYAMTSRPDSHCLVRMKFLGQRRAVSAVNHACNGVHPVEQVFTSERRGSLGREG